MYVKFDALNRHEPLVMTLCNPGSVFEDGSPTKIIGIYADTSDEELQLKFNSESELSFRLYKVEREGEDDANEYTKLVFDSTEKKRLIFVNEIGYFMITEAEEGMDDDGTYYKDVKADSIEAEMRDRALIFIDDGTYDFDALVGRIVDTVPNWTIGHVDSDVSARHRTFEDVDVEENVLGFLVEDMQDAFECIFLFDPIQRVINVYDQSNYVRTTDILISKNDVILGFEIKEDKDDLYTAIRAVGDDDLNIAAINPIGTNVLYDFTYYIDWMPEELAIKVSNWQDAVSDAEEEYYDLSLQYYDALGSKYTYTEEDAALNAQLTMYKRCRDNIVAECGDHQELVRGEPPKGTEEQVNAMLTKVTERIKVLLAKYNSAIVDSGGDSIEIDDDVSIEAEVHETLAEIDRLIAETEESIHANEVEKRNSDEEVASLLSQLNLIRDSLSFENNFTDEELAELSSYVYEGTYSDDYVKVTEDMTHAEQFEQMKILYDRAKSTLKKASQPMKEFDIDVENFVFEKAFENKTEQLETGCVIDVELHDDEITSLFLSEITVNYEDHKLSLRFGSQFSRFDPKSMFEDVLGNVKKSANTLDYIKDLVYPIKNGDFNVMKNALKTSRTITMDNALASTDQDVVIDVSGYTGRRIMEDGNIDPQQIKITNKNIVLTDDAWDSAKVAIGELFLGDGTTAYGVNAEVLMGDVIIGNQLHILNEDGNDVFQVTDEKLESQYTRFSNDIGTLTTNYSRIEQTADNITIEVGRIQEDLDRKVETYSQPDAPASTGRVTGDIWIDSDDNNAMYRWDGTGWVSVRDGTIATAQGTADSAYAMAQTAIQNVDVEYALGASNTTAPADDSPAWQTESPTWEEGKYVWQRTATTANGVTTYSDPVCIQGASGQDGEDGKGIDHITEYYAVSSSGTTAPNSGWTTTIQNTTTTNRYLWNYEKITYSDNSEEDTLKRVIGTHGESGSDSTSYSLIVSDAAIVKASDNSLLPSSITLTAKSQSGSGAISNYSGRFKIETSTDLSVWTSAYTSSSNESSKTYSVPSGIRGIRCSLYLAGGTTTLLDQQTVPVVSDGIDGQDGTDGTNGVDGKDAYTVILTNESHTFAAGTSAAIAGSTECQVIAYKGATQVSATIGTISGQPTGMTTSISSNNSTSAKFTVNVTTSMTTRNGVLTVPITVDGKSFSKRFTYSLAIKGTDGEDGVGINSVSVTYGVSSSATTQPTSWQGSIPNVPDGDYLWTRTITDYTDSSLEDTVSYTYSRQGEDGDNGTAGTSVTVSSIKYQAGTSPTSAPTGTWSDNVVAVAEGQYLWTKTTFSDGNVAYGVARQGQNGADSTVYSLIVSNSAIVKTPSDGYSPSSITLTAKSQTGASALANYSGRFKIETSTDMSTWTSAYTSSANESTKSYTIPANIYGVRCSLYLAGGTTTLLDQQTIPVVSDGVDGQDGTNGTDGIDGQDAYTVILTNESHTFAAGTSAAIAGSTECQVIAYKGATQVAATIGTISGAPTGMSTSISSNNSTSAKFTVSVTTSMTTKNGVLTVPITVDGKAFSKKFTYSLAIAGEKGDQGVSVSTITNYYLATSASSGVTTSTTGWTTTVQSMTATNQYLWAYEVIKGSDNSTIRTTSPVIIGRYGQNGADGNYPTTMTERYYLSTSNTTQSGGSWSDTQPEWSSGKYIWTRIKVDWHDGTTTYTSPTLAKALNSANSTSNRADIMSRARRGVALFNDPDFASGLNGCIVYDNSNDGNVTVTRVSSPSGTPTKSGYVLKIENSGSANPGLGGFLCSFSMRANAEFVQIYKLLVPTGYTVTWAGNSGGDGRVVTSLTSMAGTGKWEEYAFYVKCGSTGSFSSAGHVYLTGTAGTTSNPVTWYCCSCQVYDISQTFNPNTSANIVEEQWAYGTASAAQSNSWSSSKVTPTSTYQYLWKRIKTTTVGGTVVYKPSENGVLSSEDSRARALIEATADSITLGVTQSSTSATIQMSIKDADGTSHTSSAPTGGTASIDLTGLVTFSSLESYSVGSRNMLKNSNKAISNGNYNIASYYLDSAPIVGEWYTLTIRGTLASTKSYWGFYNSGGSVSFGTVTPSEKGTAATSHLTFQWKNTNGSTTVTPTYVNIYAMNNGQSGTSSIEWVTLTKGKNPSETWELCPSDLSGQNSTTTINGGNITTHTIDANRMNVSTLSSITANIGEVTAGLVRSNDGTTFFDLDNATLKTYSEDTTPFPWADLTFGYETQIANGVVTCHTGQYQSSNQFSYEASSYLSAQGLTIAGYPSDEAFKEANYRADSQTIYSGSGEALGRSYGARVASYDMTLITHGGESSLNPYRVDAILGNAANAVMDHVRVEKQNWGTSLSVIVGAEATHGILMINDNYFGFWWVAGNSGSMSINVQKIWGSGNPTITFTETVSQKAFGRITVSVSNSSTITMFIHTTRKGIMAIAGGYMI